MYEHNIKSAGEKLRSIRNKEGLSLYKAARNIHITGNYLSLIERGKRVPSNEVLINIADFYNISREELFSLYDKIPPNTKYEELTKELRKIITQISIDNKLTTEEKEKCIEQILLIAKEIAGGQQ